MGGWKSNQQRSALTKLPGLLLACCGPAMQPVVTRSHHHDHHDDHLLVSCCPFFKLKACAIVPKKWLAALLLDHFQPHVHHRWLILMAQHSNSALGSKVTQYNQVRDMPEQQTIYAALYATILFMMPALASSPRPMP